MYTHTLLSSQACTLQTNTQTHSKSVWDGESYVWVILNVTTYPSHLTVNPVIISTSKREDRLVELERTEADMLSGMAVS